MMDDSVYDVYLAWAGRPWSMSLRRVPPQMDTPPPWSLRVACINDNQLLYLVYKFDQPHTMYPLNCSYDYSRVCARDKYESQVI